MRGLAALGRSPLHLLGDGPVPHREHLEAARVRDDRAPPAHELVQAAHRCDVLVAGLDEQVEGVAKDHLVAQAATSLAWSDFTVAVEASGTNAGVRTSPCSVRRTPARAVPSRASIVNVNSG